MAKYKAYPDYKDSGIESLDTIPKMWSIKKLKYIFEIKKRIAGKIGFDVLSVTQKGIKIKDIESGEGQLSMDYSKYQRVYPGEFAMNHMDLLTGYVDISIYDGVTSPDYRVFVVRDKHSFYSRYYLYLLQDGYKQRRFFHLGQGSAHLGRWRLPTEAFNEIVYPCPSLKEQNQIASFLDHETAKIDNLIKKQKQLIELLKEKRQAVISHAVTKGLNPDVPMKDSGVEWLGEVPAHWLIKKLKYLCSIQTGSKDTVNAIEDGLYPFFVRSQTIERINSVGADCEAVLTAGDGAGVGKVYHYYNGKFDFHQRVYMLNNFKAIKGRFVYYYLSSNFYKVALEGNAKSTVDSLRLPQFLNFEFSLPSIKEQENIIYFLELETAKIDSLVEKQQQQIELLRERRTALISAAVTGKIDLRDWIAPDTQDVEEPQEATA